MKTAIIRIECDNFECETRLPVPIDERDWSSAEIVRALHHHFLPLPNGRQLLEMLVRLRDAASVCDDNKKAST